MQTPTLALLALLFTAPALLAQEAEALSAINAHRANKGCDPLVLQPQLQAAAEGHANNMATQDFFSHNGKDGSKFSRRIKAEGYGGSRIAENIAAGQKSGSDVVAAWMASAGHKRNILDCRFTHTGLAMAYQSDDQPIKGSSHALKYYWVQTFGRP
jgi:uncharacterized protein YkwD